MLWSTSGSAWAVEWGGPWGGDLVAVGEVCIQVAEVGVWVRMLVLSEMTSCVLFCWGSGWVQMR